LEIRKLNRLSRLERGRIVDDRVKCTIPDKSLPGIRFDDGSRGSSNISGRCSVQDIPDAVRAFEERDALLHANLRVGFG